MEPSADLADRVRTELTGRGLIREVKMFGGLSFMKDDRMVLCISRDGGLLARVAPERDAELVARPGARRAEMGTGRSMGTGWIAVDATRLESNDEFRLWMDERLHFHAQGSGKANDR